MATIGTHLAMIFGICAMLFAATFPIASTGSNAPTSHATVSEHVHAQGHGPVNSGHGGAVHDHHGLDTLTAGLVNGIRTATEVDAVSRPATAVGRPRRPGTPPKGARLVAERTSALIDWFFRCR